MSFLRRGWNDFWFEPSSGERLGVARIVFFLLLARHAATLGSPAWKELADAIWVPVSFFRWTAHPVPSATALGAMQAGLVVAALASAAGVFTRIAMPVAAVLAFYLLGLPNNFGKVNHEFNAAMVTLAFLALSRAGDRYSLDAWFDARRSRRAPAPSGEYTWPIRAGLLGIVVMYFSAGIAKLRDSGIKWALSDNFQLLLLRHHYSHAPPTRLGFHLAQHDVLCRVFACAALAIETLCPLALFNRHLRAFFGFALTTLQLGIWLTMGIVFRGVFWVFLAFWVPWDVVLGWARARVAARTRAPTAAGT